MQRFKLTEQHIALLRQAHVSWFDCEHGAPCIDPKRPYGNSSVVEDVCRILDLGRGGDDEDAQYDQACQLHEETETALQIVLATGTFTPGYYEADDYQTNWRLATETNLEPKYNLFGGFYPEGGQADFIGSFRTIEGAVARLRSLGLGSCNWAHVVDANTEIEVWRAQCDEE